MRKEKTICSFSGCPHIEYARKLCHGHYEQKRIGKGLVELYNPVHRRFWTKVEVLSIKSCWLWRGTIDSKGYGVVRINQQSFRAHRVAYELLVGNIPSGLCIDHLCRTRSCVNPIHMEVCTPKENSFRGVGPAAINRRKTYCIHGHSLNEGNMKVTSRGWRVCLVCVRARKVKYRGIKAVRKNLRE